MKSLLFALLVFAVGVSVAGDKPAKKFKVTYTITYDAATLSEAAAIEEALRLGYEKVDVKVEEQPATAGTKRFWSSPVDSLVPKFVPLPWSTDPPTIRYY